MKPITRFIRSPTAAVISLTLRSWTEGKFPSRKAGIIGEIFLAW
jgi:hypothetical protein